MTTVVIPVAGDCPHRARALTWVTRRYDQLGWPVLIGHGDAQHWSKAAAARDALDRQELDPDEILIVADGDVWADHIEQAVNDVRGAAPWAIPHTKVYRLSPNATDRLLAGEPPSSKHRDLARVPFTGIPGGGLVVLTRELYEQVPLDPRFVGWGGEDHSWGYALTTLAGPPARDIGPLWHLWHPPQPRARGIVSGNVRNERLRKRYRDARAAPAAMRALVDEVTDDASARHP